MKKSIIRELKDLKAAVVGNGYVELINKKQSSIQSEYIKYLAEKDLGLTATLDEEKAYNDADFVIVAVPTNYDSKKNFFD